MRLLLDPLVTIEGQNNINQPATPLAVTPAPATASKPSTIPAIARKPTEAELKTEFKLDSSLFPDEPAVKVEQLPVAPAAKEPDTSIKPKIEAAPKKEDKTVAPAAPEPKKSLTDGPITAAPKGAEGVPFDYTGFTDMQVQHLKKMSNEAREYAVSVIKENRELSKLKGGEFLQHPEAYTLSPEFRELREQSFYAGQEAMHWEEQLIKIRAGQEWQNISYDPNGKMVVGPLQKPDGRIELRVQEALMKCRSVAERAEHSAQQLQTQYGERVKQDAAAINTIRAQSFGWVADPKGLEQKVDIGGGKEKTVKQIREDFLSMVPLYLRDTVGFQVAADCFAGIQIYGQTIRALESETKIAQIKTEEVRRAEPSATERPQTGGAVNGIKEFSLAGMPPL